MRKFAERTKLTGQLCFDFIREEASGGACFPIECNPRVHSQCAAFPFGNDGDGEQPQFGDAVLANHFPETLYPRAGEPPVFWLYNEVRTYRAQLNGSTQVARIFCLVLLGYRVFE